VLTVVRPPCDAGVLRGAPETPGCASHARSWVLVVTILGSSVAFLEGSIINVALPAIQRGLGASVGQMQWIASVYTLLLAALILAAGSLGDRFGRLRLFVVGLAILAVASAGAAAARNGTDLIVARAVQGFGGALLVPNSLALLSAAFPKSTRGRAIGTWSAFTALTGAGGPIVGGALVDAASWRAAFLLLVPLALVTLAIALARVPDVRIGRDRPTIDWWGAGLATAGLTLLVFGIIGATSGGVAQASVLGPVVAGLALLAVFVLLETRTPSPMMPPDLFRSPTFLGANLLTLLVYFALTGIFFVLPFNLVRVHGYSATMTGAAYLPFALIIGVLSRWAGGLLDRFGARLPLIVGPVITAAGFLLFALPGATGSYWTTFFPAMVVVGLGMAVTVAPLTSTVMAAVDETRVGVASGVNNAVARVAALLAVAIVGVVALAVFSRALSSRVDAIDLPPALRSVMVAQSGSLGDVSIPAGASADQARALEGAVGDSLVACFRWVAILAALLAVAGGIAAAVTLEPTPTRIATTNTAAPPSCAHVDLVSAVSPRSPGCEECLRSGSRWVHLRVCLSCGFVGCCDASKNRHATAHFWATKHPIVRSLEPGESWRWCYLDETAV
jgi:EmrB/QacA subfamily drug resistance transporter